MTTVRHRQVVAGATLSLSLAVAMALGLQGTAIAGTPPIPIPQDPNDQAAVPAFVGAAAVPNPVSAQAVPENPFMAPNGRSNIHDDAYMTDAYTWGGPLGQNTEVRSTYQNAECASMTFDAEGRIVTVCVGVEAPKLVLIDPDTLETEAELPLPARSAGGGTGGSFFTDFSGGGYFYLDGEDRSVIPTNNHQIWVVAEKETAEGTQFEVQRVYDLNTEVLPNEAIVSALPDWGGRIWFVTTRGLVGFVDPESGAVKSVRLEGEVIANSFAVDETGGVYIVSDHALYRFDADGAGDPAITWRKAYDRGSRVKPGQVSQGSGTTPTLMGRKYVAITDNADPRMHVLVYRRVPHVSRPRLVCANAVFEPGESATENSLIASRRSLIVENNYGYTGPTSTTNGAATEPGVTRIRLVKGGGCHKVWTSDERVPSTVSKLSAQTGLVYVYSKDPGPDDVDAWYFTAIDFRSGETVYKRLAGTGLGYNNNYAPVTLGPDGAGYVGALGGLVQVRDVPDAG